MTTEPSEFVARDLSWRSVWKAINAMQTARGEWCGIPVPLPGLGLVMESRYPHHAELAELQRIIEENEPRPPRTITCRDGDLSWRIINTWDAHERDGQIVVIRNDAGKTEWFFESNKPKRNRLLIGAMDALDAWSLDTELTAIDLLGTLLTERMFGSYILTGGFLETSKRSGLTYWFRRCRPTIVMTPHRAGDEMQILCCLCQHPLGYYSSSFCGAMVPTDDIIASLLLMRGDEHAYWKRSNQHPAHAVESGL
jgi:hypothetical protein